MASFTYSAKADANGSSQIKVTETFSAPASKIVIDLTGDPIDYSADQKTNRFPILTVPAGDMPELSAFEFHPEATWATDLHFEIVDNGSTKTLCVVAAPMVKLLVSDTGTYNRDTGTTALKTDDPTADSPWSDGQWPHEGADYLVIGSGMYLRTWSQYRLAPWTFPGRSLTIADGACFINLIADDLASAGIVANYRLAGGTLANAKSTDAHFLGTFEAVAGTTSRIEGGISKKLYLQDGSLTGSGNLVFAGAGFNATEGTTILDLDKSAFTGKIAVGLGFAASDSKHELLRIGGSFGTALPAFAADGVDLGEYATIEATSPLTVAADSNRGVTVHDVVRFAPTVANPIVIETPVVNNGTIRVTGDGALSLAGTMTSAANAAVSVEAGTLCLAGSGAVAGSKLVFAAGTKLEIALDSADAALCATGIDLSALDDPIALDASFGGKLPFTVVNAGAKENFTSAILTCSAAAADAVRAMLPTTISLKGFVPAAVQERTDPTTGAVTFFVELARPGFLLQLR